MIDELGELAVEVQSEVTTSKDVTDEYVDTTARLTNQQATQDALIRLLERAEKVEDALQVQNELTRVQEEIERLQGRIKFLEQTSAFSLVNVRLSLDSVDMSVDAGADRTVSVGRVARFRATFEPPEDMEEFNFTWDFGDGNRITETRTAPTVEEGKRVTATVTHVYGDDRDSPFIVGIEITGFGDEGLADGSDTVIVTVTKIPSIEVFAGESMTVEAGRDRRPGGIIHPAGGPYRLGVQVGLRRWHGPCHLGRGGGRDQGHRRPCLRRPPPLPIHRNPDRHGSERRRRDRGIQLAERVRRRVRGLGAVGLEPAGHVEAGDPLAVWRRRRGRHRADLRRDLQPGLAERRRGLGLPAPQACRKGR